VKPFLSFSLLAAVGIACAVQAETSTATTVRDLLQAVSERRADVPFDIKVTVIQPCRFKSISNITCIEDETGGIGIKDMVSEDGCDPEAGNVVRFRGKTELVAGVSIFPMATELNVLDKGLPPVASPVSAIDFHSGRFDRRLVEVDGFVSEVSRDEIDSNWCFVCLRCPSGTVHAAWPRAMISETDATKLIDAHIRLRGICTPNANSVSSRRYLDHCLSVNSRDNISILNPPPANPFECPPAVGSGSADMLMAGAGTGRRSVTGSVLAVWHGNRILIQTKDGEIIQSVLSGGTPPTTGMTVDVAGFPETDFYRLTLARALWRPANACFAYTATATELTSVAAILKGPSGEDKVNIAAHGRLIRITGRVCTLPSPDRGGWQIHLQNGDFMIPIYGQSEGVFANAPVGGSCEITGICLLETESWRQQAPFPHVTGMALILRSPEDIRVLVRPPFWTPDRLLIIIGTLLAALCAILVWNQTLRVLVERRSRELFRQQIDSATSKLRVVERTQLAVELHDSLSQSLAGVAMELEAARQFPEGAAHELLRHLAIAWNTLKSCRNELRNCLWDLRTDALEERDMENAVRTALQPHVGGIRLAVRFAVSRLSLTDNTTHAILRIIRELVLNAIRHGQARSIRVAGSLENDELHFSVTDDGTGFDSASAPGVKDGHFGLSGIRERLRHLNGSMRIDSASGHGSKVTVTLKLATGTNKNA